MASADCGAVVQGLVEEEVRMGGCLLGALICKDGVEPQLSLTSMKQTSRPSPEEENNSGHTFEDGIHSC